MYYYIYYILKSLEFVIKFINCMYYIFINIYVINDFKIVNLLINVVLCNYYIFYNLNI